MPQNHVAAFFTGLAINWYGWNLQFLTDQYKLWMEGVRDSRIHDATPSLIKLAEEAANAVI